MRIGVAGFMHESSTFSPKKTDLAAFEEQSLLDGPAIIAEWKEAHHEVGGFLQAAVDLDFEPVPLLMAWAMPAGPVTKDAYDTITARLIDRVQSEKLDGLLLALHGAMVAESQLDADAETLVRLRAAVGSDLPIVVTLDFHGNVSQRLIEHCNAAIAYQTNPHVDQRQRGLKAASLIVRQIRWDMRLRQALAKPRLIINIMKQDTSLEPLRTYLEQARECEKQTGVLSVSLMAGFAYADVPHMGPSIIAVTDNDQALAQQHADELADQLWQNREQFNVDLPDAKAAVEQALLTDATPVVLVDTGDNVGGGSAADGTVILNELLRQKATESVVCFYAPEEVQRCLQAGIGSDVSLTVGGKVDRLHGDPVEVKGRVRLIHEGKYVEEEVRHGGKRVNQMGLTALVEMDGGNLLVLNSLRHPPFSIGQLTCLGIAPERKRILVVKAAIAYKAAYAPIAKTIIEVDTPGFTAVNPHRFEFRNVRRPLYPLD